MNKKKVPGERGEFHLRNKFKKIRQRKNRKERKEEQERVMEGFKALTHLEMARAYQTRPEPGKQRPKASESEVPSTYLQHSLRKASQVAVDAIYSRVNIPEDIPEHHQPPTPQLHADFY